LSSSTDRDADVEKTQWQRAEKKKMVLDIMASAIIECPFDLLTSTSNVSTASLFPEDEAKTAFSITAAANFLSCVRDFLHQSDFSVLVPFIDVVFFWIVVVGPNSPQIGSFPRFCSTSALFFAFGLIDNLVRHRSHVFVVVGERK